MNRNFLHPQKDEYRVPRWRFWLHALAGAATGALVLRYADLICAGILALASL